ncbi:MAG: hypothetical protein E7289_09585 [Lachnospiraceae bacterium]|nr:hypothetical protein [Lachnospiraceae bacterium]
MLKDWFGKTGYKDRIFKHKLQVMYRTVLIIALVVVAIVILKVQADNRVYTKYEIVREMKRFGTENSTFRNYDGNILVHSKDGIAAYDENGGQMWNQSYEMQAPLVKNNGSYVAVGDYKGTTLYIIGKKGTTAEVETNLPILSLDVSAQGVAAVLLQDNDVTWLRLYSEKGELISEVKTSMRNNGYPVAFAISPDNIKLGVSYVKAEAGKINTSLAFYNFGGVGQNATDNLVSGYEYDGQIFPLITYLNETDAVAVGDERLLLLKGKQKPTLEKEIAFEQELQGIYKCETGFALVYRDLDGEGQYNIHIYNAEGEEELKHKVDFEFSDIILDDKKAIIYNEAKVLVLGLNGVEKYNSDLGGNIQALIPTDSSTEILAVFPDGIRLMKLR